MVVGAFLKRSVVNKSVVPVIIPRSEHSISRDQISENALKVLTRLREAGFDSYLVGGCVRDLLLGYEPKDFDVVTNARPEQIRRLFRNARLIGRRFRLAHVRFGREVIEVATYRALPPADEEEGPVEKTDAGRILRDNIYGTLEEDALRRDFTINALYYNSGDFTVTDFVGGLEDLRRGQVRVIGDPETRYREDPVRMLRAVRFAAKLGLQIAPETAEPIARLAPLLQDVPPARMYEEVLKLFHGGCALTTFEQLRHYDLFRPMFPLTDRVLEHEQDGFPAVLIPRALANTDARINEGLPVTPAFLYAVMLWGPVRQRVQGLLEEGLSEPDALRLAAGEAIREQVRHTAIPRRFSMVMREIWFLQNRLHRRGGARAFRLLEHPRFRAAYDFLCLRADVGELPAELCEWWTRFQAVDREQQQAMVRELPATGARRRRKRRRRKERDEPHRS